MGWVSATRLEVRVPTLPWRRNHPWLPSDNWSETIHLFAIFLTKSGHLLPTPDVCQMARYLATSESRTHSQSASHCHDGLARSVAARGSDHRRPIHRLSATRAMQSEMADDLLQTMNIGACDSWQRSKVAGCRQATGRSAARKFFLLATGPVRRYRSRRA